MRKTEKMTSTVIGTFTLATVVVGLAAVGCSHSSKSSKNSKSKYTRQIEPLSLRTEKSFGACKVPSDLSKLPWADAIQIANSCVKKKKWGKVKLLADHLSKTEFVSPWGPYYASLVAEREKHFDRAIWMIDVAIKRAPHVGLLHYQKGRLRWKLKEYNASILHFKEALDLNSNLIDAHLFLGKLYVRDQECPKSVPHWQSVLQVEGKNKDALVGLSKCRLESGNIEESLALLKKAIQYHPKNLEYRLRIAEIYEREEKDFQQALQTYVGIQDDLSSNRSWKSKIKINLKSKIFELRKLASVDMGGRQGGNRRPATKKAKK